MEIRRLREQDERSKFRSGDVDLDRFFLRYAGQNQFRHHIGVTYVAVDAGEVLGFVTVSPAEVEAENLPASLSKKLPRYPLPILRIARLAVDERARGQGLGKNLLRFALGLASQMAKDLGCMGVVVDAKPQAVEFYTRLGFTKLEAVEGASDARPAPTPMFLAMRVISSVIADRCRSAAGLGRRSSAPSLKC